VQADELLNLLKEGESEHLAFRLFFGREAIETLVAFANSQGGVLLLGVTELKEIKGIADARENVNQWIQEVQSRTTPPILPHIEIIEIEGKLIAGIAVAEYPVKPVAFEGKYYRRYIKFNKELTTREAFEFRRLSLLSRWDSNLRPEKTITDLSIKKIYQVIERISRKKQCLPEEPFTFLRKYGLTEGESITNACRLLFLPDGEPETTIELGRFSSPTVTSDSLTLKTDLFTEAEEAVRFICKHICKEKQPEASIQWQYPLEAIRELVVNMIIHRDYSSDYHSIIKIFDGYIEFYNPGAFPDDISIKNLFSNGYISRPRNPQIAELFKDAGMFEEYGSGIRQIWTVFVNSGLRPPEFIKLPDRLIVRVFGDISTNASIHQEKPETTIDSSKIKYEPEQPKEETVNFSNREHRIIRLIIKDNHIPLIEIAQTLNVSKRTVLRDLKNLKKERVIERIGNEKSGYWKIIQN